MRCHPPHHQLKRCRPTYGQSNLPHEKGDNRKEVREEEKKRRRTKEEQKTYVLFPRTALMLKQALLTSRLVPPILPHLAPPRPALPRPDPPTVSYLTGSCRRKERAERCQRKNNKNLTINQILPFVLSNLGTVTRNGDGEETADEGQRETKMRGKKHEDPAELTFVYRPLFSLLCHL